jgi:hypothetical protein
MGNRIKPIIALYVKSLHLCMQNPCPNPDSTALFENMERTEEGMSSTEEKQREKERWWWRR